MTESSIVESDDGKSRIVRFSRKFEMVYEDKYYPLPE